ncbi:hypothetical protein [Emticicia sp. 17c]|uniref:hypothetical protein n=1 Tax=Emticicia sp. 17c TaxID=3127704 RepID=UPI00301E4B21
MANTTNANSTNTTVRFWTSIVIGVLALGLGFYGTFFLPIKTSLQWIFIVLLLLTGIVSLSILWGGTITVFNTYIRATNAFALLVFLAVLIFNLFDPPAQQTSLKLQLRQENNAAALANEKQVLRISMGKETKVLDTDSNGEVLINANAETDSLQAEVLNPNWQFVKNHHATAYFLIPSTEVLQLTLEPSESRCCVSGKVIFADKGRHNLSAITVQAAGVSTLTDAQGHYRLNIPSGKRLENLKVAVFTTTHQGEVWCNTASPCDIKLIKR